MAHASIHLQTIISINPALDQVLNDSGVAHTDFESSSCPIAQAVVPSRRAKCQLCSRHNHTASSCFKLRDCKFVGLFVDALPYMCDSSRRRFKISGTKQADYSSQAPPHGIEDTAISLGNTHHVETADSVISELIIAKEVAVLVDVSPLACSERVTDCHLLTVARVLAIVGAPTLSLRGLDEPSQQDSILSDSEISLTHEIDIMSSTMTAVLDLYAYRNFAFCFATLFQYNKSSCAEASICRVKDYVSKVFLATYAYTYCAARRGWPTNSPLPSPLIILFLSFLHFLLFSSRFHGDSVAAIVTRCFWLGAYYVT